MDTAATLCIGIRKRSTMFERFLISMNSMFEPLIFEMKRIIKYRGTDYNEFTKSERQVVSQAIAIEKAIKSILNTSILDREGNLTVESEKIIEIEREKMEKRSI